MQNIIINPIGVVKSSRVDVEDDYWGNTNACIELLPELFDKESLKGLDQFSHVYILFYMHKVMKEKIVYGSVHPRNNSSLPETGVFAQRGKNRPNRIGLSCVRLRSVQPDNLTIIVDELDAIDGTPVLDIKPFIKQFSERGKVYQPSWVDNVMRNYWAKHSNEIQQT